MLTIRHRRDSRNQHVLVGTMRSGLRVPHSLQRLAVAMYWIAISEKEAIVAPACCLQQKGRKETKQEKSDHNREL